MHLQPIINATAPTGDGSLNTSHSGPRGGHRRRLAELAAGIICTAPRISALISEANIECCDEPGEECDNGIIRTCNEGCARLMISLWSKCGSLMESIVGPVGAEDMRGAAATCTRAEADRDPELFLGGTMSLMGAHLGADITVTVGAGSMFQIDGCTVDAQVGTVTFVDTTSSCSSP